MSTQQDVPACDAAERSGVIELLKEESTLKQDGKTEILYHSHDANFLFILTIVCWWHYRGNKNVFVLEKKKKI